MSHIIHHKETNAGFLLVNKPSGPTSHDIIDKMRRITGIRKIGHAGTLDPFATGLLLVAVGRSATKEISKFVKLHKEYVAELCLGVSTDTYDREGVKTEHKVKRKPGLDQVKEVLKKFIGAQKQIPPMYSAKKIGGHKLYELARQGKEIKRDPVDIVVDEIEMLEYDFPKLVLRIACSSGTYIRSLAHDLGQALACGAYLNELKRTKVGEFSIEQAHEIEAIKKRGWTDKLFK